MTDANLLALCIWTEASGEPYEGKLAVSRVLHNRMATRFFSDGTVAGTVLRKDQFSAFWFQMDSGRYRRVASDVIGAIAEAERLLPLAKASAVWDDCVRAATFGTLDSGFAGGPEWRKLAAEPRTLLYCNRDISAPVWATDADKVATIFHHTFYRAA